MKDKNVNQRRSFLQGVALGGAAVSLPMSVSAALKPIADQVERSEFPMPDFASVVGESVLVKCAAGVSHSAKITEVSELHANCNTHVRPAHLRSCATVVRFNVVDTEAFDNEVYPVAHPQLGNMDLLLSVVPDANGVMGLEAIFN